MHWSIGSISDLFPDLHPRYQKVFETVTFIVVAAMLIGSLLGGLALVIHDL